MLPLNIRGANLDKAMMFVLGSSAPEAASLLLPSGRLPPTCPCCCRDGARLEVPARLYDWMSGEN